MKKIIFYLAAAAVCFATAGCENVDDLWDAVDDLEGRVTAVEASVAKANDDIAALQTLVEALQKQITIDSIVRSGDGYLISFSDGTKLAISAGGGVMPLISVKEEDGEYYWTVNGEFMLDDEGNKVRASANDGADGADGAKGPQGPQGESGADGVTPVIRVNSATGEWEYSLDEGASWTSTGVKAAGEKGADGDSFFRSVVELEDEVVFTLEDGTSFSLPKTDAFSFVVVRDSEGEERIKYGDRREFAVESKGVEDVLVFSCPKGWSAAFDGSTLTVAAPASSAASEADGEVVLLVTSIGGATKIVRVSVVAYEYDLRVLTFEDEDYKGSEGSSYWSSLVDSQQYGGPLIYGDYDYCDYDWTDDGNTFLSSGLVELYEMKVFWNGGHVISNYALTDLDKGDYTTQLSVYYQDEKTGYGGHNGSKNFCIHNGYADFSSYSSNLPELRFADGNARVVDHMWVMVTTYTAKSLLIGDGFSGNAAGANDWFCIQAQGYDSADSKTTDQPLEFYIFKDGKIITEWTKWDLSSLGEVSYIKFNCAGSMTGSYGLNTPAYFAYDDVAVRF